LITLLHSGALGVFLAYLLGLIMAEISFILPLFFFIAPNVSRRDGKTHFDKFKLIKLAMMKDEIVLGEGDREGN